MTATTRVFDAYAKNARIGDDLWMGNRWLTIAAMPEVYDRTTFGSDAVGVSFSPQRGAEETRAGRIHIFGPEDRVRIRIAT